MNKGTISCKTNDGTDILLATAIYGLSDSTTTSSPAFRFPPSAATMIAIGFDAESSSSSSKTGTPTASTSLAIIPGELGGDAVFFNINSLPTNPSSSSADARDVLLLVALFRNLFAALSTPAALRKVLSPLNASWSSCSVGSAMGSETFSSYERRGSVEWAVSQGSDQRDWMVERSEGDLESSCWRRVWREGLR